MDQLAARPRDYDGREVSVLASLIEIRGVPILCGALAEIAPDGCAGPRLGVVGPIPDGAMGQTVIATGIFRAERGPAAMVLELRTVRPAGG